MTTQRQEYFETSAENLADLGLPSRQDRPGWPVPLCSCEGGGGERQHYKRAVCFTADHNNVCVDFIFKQKTFH